MVALDSEFTYIWDDWDDRPDFPMGHIRFSYEFNITDKIPEESKPFDLGGLILPTILVFVTTLSAIIWKRKK